jgi:hypothetical protein
MQKELQVAAKSLCFKKKRDDEKIKHRSHFNNFIHVKVPNYLPTFYLLFSSPPSSLSLSSVFWL